MDDYLSLTKFGDKKLLEKKHYYDASINDSFFHENELKFTYHETIKKPRMLN